MDGIRGTFFPSLAEGIQNISMVDFGSIAWSRAMVRPVTLDTLGERSALCG